MKIPTIPSVLVETGFLSNPKEEKYLLSKKGQIEMAQGISNGVMKFFGKETTSAEIVSKVETSINNTQTTNGSDNKYIVQIGVFSKKKDSNQSRLL